LGLNSAAPAAKNNKANLTEVANPGVCYLNRVYLIGYSILKKDKKEREENKTQEQAIQ